MRLLGFGFAAAMGGLLVLPVATPSAAGALGDLVGFGAQDVYIDPPADAPATGSNTGAVKTPGQKIKKTKKIRLSRDCVKAGLKTTEDCDAFHAAQAKTPAEPAPAAKELGDTAVTGIPPAATSTPPAETATTQPPAATGNGAPTTVVAMPTNSGAQSSSTLSAVTTGGSNAPSTNCSSGGSTLGTLVAVTPSC